MKKIKIIFLVVVLFCMILPITAGAYPGGILQGKTMKISSDFNLTGGTNETLMTDGSESSCYYMNAPTVVVWSNLGFNRDITDYQIKADMKASNLYLRFHDEQKNIISGVDVSNKTDGTKRTISTVKDVRYVSLANQGGALVNVCEMDVFSPTQPPPPAIPTGLTVTPGNGEATLNWNTVNDVSGYRIYKNGVYLYTVNHPGTTYKATGLTNGTSYSFQVSAINESSVESDKSIAVNVTPLNTTPPPAPNGLNAIASSGTTNLSWAAVTGVTDLAGYNVYANGQKVNAVPLTSTTYTVTGLENNVTNDFYVTAINTSGFESTASDTVYTNFDAISPLAPIGLVGVANNGYVDLQWQANTEPDLAGYNAYVDSTKHNTALITTNAYRVNGLTNKQQYAFAVTALDTNGNESLKSDVVYVTPAKTTPPAVPTGLTVTAGDGQAALTWDAVDEVDVAGYRIYKNGVFLYMVNQPGTSYTATGLTNGTSYNFQVSAIDTSGNESAKSAAISVTPTKSLEPTAPKSVKVVTSSQKVVLSWNAAPSPDTKFLVYRDGVLIGEVTEPTYTDTTVSNGTKYKYEIAAANSEGESKKAQIFAKPSEVTDMSETRLPFQVSDMIGTAINFLRLYPSWILVALGIIFVPIFLAIIGSLFGYNDPKKGKEGRQPREGKRSSEGAKPKTITREKFEKDKQQRDKKAAAAQERASRTTRLKNEVSEYRERKRKKDGTLTAREKANIEKKAQAHILKMRKQSLGR